MNFGVRLGFADFIVAIARLPFTKVSLEKSLLKGQSSLLITPVISDLGGAIPICDRSYCETIADLLTLIL